MIKHETVGANTIEISAEQKKLLTELSFFGPLHDQDILVVALVYLGLKPAAVIHLPFFESAPDYDQQDYLRDIEETRQLLKKMGLVYESTKTFAEEEHDPTITTSFYLSKFPQTATKLHEAFAEGNSDEAAELLGYPETAIKAFPHHTVRLDPSHELMKSEVAPFLYFMPSEENWRQEIEPLEKSVALIKQTMPDLYQRLVLKHQSEIEETMLEQKSNGYSEETMQFKTIAFPEVLEATKIPSDIQLALPESSQLPLDQQHFLLYIPWDDKYLQLVPAEFRNFYTQILPLLNVRTTDVHTAISSSYLDILIPRINKPLNRRAVALALFLHDAGWSKLSEKEVAESLGVKGLALTETAMGPKEKHAVEGEKIAREVLANTSFEPPLSPSEIELICKAILYHDKPEAVAGAGESMPLEVQVLVDLDHIWSFTHENFWQDTVRKGVNPAEYLKNLSNDLDGYFVTTEGKQLARELLAERSKEVMDFE